MTQLVGTYMATSTNKPAPSSVMVCIDDVAVLALPGAASAGAPNASRRVIRSWLYWCQLLPPQCAKRRNLKGQHAHTTRTAESVGLTNPPDQFRSA